MMRKFCIAAAVPFLVGLAYHSLILLPEGTYPHSLRTQKSHAYTDLTSLSVRTWRLNEPKKRMAMYDNRITPTEKLHFCVYLTISALFQYRPPSDAQFVTSLKEHLDVTAKSNRNVRSSLFVETAGGAHDS